MFNITDRQPNQIGPGRKSNLRYVKPSRYMPHQGEQEKARRRGAALDSAGQPWNPDLHAATRSLNKDGTWRKKGGRR